MRFINKFIDRFLYLETTFASCSERVDLFIRGFLSITFNLDCFHLEACSNLNLVNISPGLLQIFQKHGLKSCSIKKDNIFLGSNIIKVEQIICLFLRVLINLWLLIRLGTRDIEAALGSWWLLMLLRGVHGKRNLLDPLSWGIHVECNLFHFSWGILSELRWWNLFEIYFFLIFFWRIHSELNLFDFLDFLRRKHLECDLLDFGFRVFFLLGWVCIESYFLYRGFFLGWICLELNLLNLFLNWRRSLKGNLLNFFWRI